MFGGWDDRRIADMLSVIPSASKRIWFVLSYHESTGGFSIEDYIRRNYRLIEIKDFVRVKIYLVSTPDVLPVRRSAAWRRSDVKG